MMVTVGKRTRPSEALVTSGVDAFVSPFAVSWISLAYW